MMKLPALCTLFCLLLLLSSQQLFALPPDDDLIEITNKRGELQICNGDLGDIFRKYATATASENIYFEELQILKADKAYFLLAKEQNSTNAYAFSLYRHKGALVLDTTAGIKVTAKGEAALRAAILHGDQQASYLKIVTARNNMPAASETNTH
ncbi:hypothetical protein [Pontibacter beigongshangensis]|uniref:hypothetical protein n=1 Tax=Pontibacter beigongshangensis TaxID=2574733 RepID=UPI00164F543C|nr:hypothetical protein [Pontibacter beigongshangensis]